MDLLSELPDELLVSAWTSSVRCPDELLFSAWTSSVAAAAPRMDLLSALPDELLVTILHGLDTRSALATAILAKRWARLPRQLRAIDFRVTDMFPPAYHESVDLLEDHMRRTMASYNDALDSFIEAEANEDGNGGYIPRRLERLRLEFFDPDEPFSVDRLIAKAVTNWGVEDLEVRVKRPSSARRAAYLFPHELLNDESVQRIRSLTLGGFDLLPPLHEYGGLTALVLQDISQPMTAYTGVVSMCPQLQSVHLRRCRAKTHSTIPRPRVMEVDAPASGLRELVVHSCSGSFLILAFGNVPRLAHVNLDVGFFIVEGEPWDRYQYDYTLNKYVAAVVPAAATELVLRFTGTYRWANQCLAGVTPFLGLRRLLVADVPFNWDLSWPCLLLLLQAAPSLEVLHVSITGCEDSRGRQARNAYNAWVPTNFRHTQMEELVIVGFELTR
nr:putative F-box protein At3g58860 [Aegilops tauschii subsp. strangulata]